MNTVHNDQERRSIKVKEFLQDFYGGMMDGDLLAKYRLTPTGLEKFYTMLQDKGILYPEEISARYAQIASQERPDDNGEVEETSSFVTTVDFGASCRLALPSGAACYQQRVPTVTLGGDVYRIDQERRKDVSKNS